MGFKAIDFDVVPKVIIKEKPKAEASLKPQKEAEKKREKDIEDYVSQDWVKYFKFKAEDHGIKYFPNYAKDNAIFKKLMKEFHADEIKDMVDFLFDSDQDIKDKSQMGVWILSGGWLSTVYNASVAWKKGEYKSKNAPKHNREWTDGISYGKPVEKCRTENNKSVRF